MGQERAGGGADLAPTALFYMLIFRIIAKTFMNMKQDFVIHTKKHYAVKLRNVNFA